jgi:zinc transport system permease protein
MAVKNMIPEALAYGFMQRAYLAGVLSASALSIVGVFIVLRRMSNIGEGLSNIAFAGVSIGLVAGMAPLPAALAAVLVGVIVIRHLMGRKRCSGRQRSRFSVAGALHWES